MSLAGSVIILNSPPYSGRSSIFNKIQSTANNPCYSSTANGEKTINGWYSDHAKDSEHALEFSKLANVRPMVEAFPLESVNEAYDRMFDEWYAILIDNFISEL